jgi:hypothetical protein
MFAESTKRSAVPVFLMVTVFDEVPPTFRGEKLTDAGLTDIFGAGVVAAYAPKENGSKDSKAAPMINDNPCLSFLNSAAFINISFQ